MKKIYILLLIILMVLSTWAVFFTGIKLQGWMHIQLELLMAKITWLMSILGFVAYLFFKRKKKILLAIYTLCLFISLCFNVKPLLQYYKIQMRIAVEREYRQLTTEEEIRQRFQSDLKNNELKYFYFGLGTPLGLDNKLENECGIELFSMGCLVENNLDQYSKLVEKEYLNKKFNTSVGEIFSAVSAEFLTFEE